LAASWYELIVSQYQLAASRYQFTALRYQLNTSQYQLAPFLYQLAVSQDQYCTSLTPNQNDAAPDNAATLTVKNKADKRLIM
jgi:hypothetical protein